MDSTGVSNQAARLLCMVKVLVTIDLTGGLKRSNVSAEMKGVFNNLQILQGSQTRRALVLRSEQRWFHQEQWFILTGFSNGAVSVFRSRCRFFMNLTEISNAGVPDSMLKSISSHRINGGSNLFPNFSFRDDSFSNYVFKRSLKRVNAISPLLATISLTEVSNYAFALDTP